MRTLRFQQKNASQRCRRGRKKIELPEAGSSLSLLSEGIAAETERILKQQQSLKAEPAVFAGLEVTELTSS